MSLFDKIAKAAPCPPTIEERADGWYWADETWAQHGPLATRAEAVAAQDKYCREELGMYDPDPAESASPPGSGR